MKTVEKTTSSQKINTKGLVITAMMSALVLVFTAFVNVKIPFLASNGGLIHLGNIPLFIAAIIFGKKTGCIAGAIGMGLFDLLSGWVSWAPFTFIIVGLMGFTVGLITEKKEHKKFGWYLLAVAVALLIKIAGYYIAEVVLYGNMLAPLTSIPGNIVQVSVAGIIVLPLAKQLSVVATQIGLVEK